MLQMQMHSSDRVWVTSVQIQMCSGADGAIWSSVECPRVRSARMGKPSAELTPRDRPMPGLEWNKWSTRLDWNRRITVLELRDWSSKECEWDRWNAKLDWRRWSTEPRSRDRWISKLGRFRPRTGLEWDKSSSEIEKWSRTRSEFNQPSRVEAISCPAAALFEVSSSQHGGHFTNTNRYAIITRKPTYTNFDATNASGVKKPYRHAVNTR